MGLGDRVLKLAKGYLDKATERWEDLDEKAQAELDKYAGRPQTNASAWERAAAKIAENEAVRQNPRPTAPLRDTLNDVPAGYEPPIPHAAAPTETATVDAAYRVLGIAPGSSFDTVQKAYDRLRERTAASRFPSGSIEQEQAKKIERRISAAYMLLTEYLKPTGDRFGRLEL